MTPTQNLIQEHRIINELLGYMNKIAEKIKSRQVFYTSDIEEIAYFLTNFIEKSHHEKEDIFYPELYSADIQIDKETISLMLYEHVLTHSYLKEINNCLVNCKLGNSFSDQLLADSMLKYVSLNSDHMHREIEIIFPVANKTFSEKKQNEILSKFVEIDDKIKSHEFQQHYLRILGHLRTKYSD
jgi:hemerythrin-like domain-containing protein